ncbi:MAG: hypothetical protein ACI4GO_00860 [Hominenteromicrobium sp.]
MEWTFVIRIPIPAGALEVSAVLIGTDLLVCLQGGDRPHIGCAVQAVPRPSLTGDGSYSATSCVLNLPGHKDEALCRLLAEQLCAALRTNVVCTGGVHIDRITPAQIEEVTRAAREAGDALTKKILERNGQEHACIQ